MATMAVVVYGSGCLKRQGGVFEREGLKTQVPFGSHYSQCWFAPSTRGSFRIDLRVFYCGTCTIPVVLKLLQLQRHYAALHDFLAELYKILQCNKQILRLQLVQFYWTIRIALKLVFDYRIKIAFYDIAFSKFNAIANKKLEAEFYACIFKMLNKK